MAQCEHNGGYPNPDFIIDKWMDITPFCYKNYLPNLINLHNDVSYVGY